MQLTSLSLALTRAGFLTFSPSALFAAGEQGAWYDPSDIERYTAPLGPELVTNGDFSNGTTGWSANNSGVLSSAAGVATITNGGAAVGRGSQAVPTVIGTWYKVTATFSNPAGGSPGGQLYAGTTTGAFDIAFTAATVGPAVMTFRATTATTSISFVAGIATLGASVQVDNISVKELTAIDTATMFQDSAGTTPVTAVEQPVGLMLDKSKGLVLGPELVTNGDFSNGTTGWTTNTGWAITGGQLVATNATGTSATTQQITTGAGRGFLITFTVVSISSGNVSVGLAGSLGTARAAPGTYTEILFGTAATNQLAIYQRTSTLNAVIDNISVRELPGNHAFQATAASRPVLSARVNLLTKTEQFDDTAWPRTVNVTPNVDIAPDGSLTADLLTTQAVSSANIRQNVSLSAGQHTLSFWVKGNTSTSVSFGMFLSGFLSGSAAVISGPGAVSGSSLIVLSGLSTSEWTRVSFTFTAATSLPTFYLYPEGTGVGTGKSVYAWGADLRVTNDAAGQPVYQRVNTSTDYDTVGFKSYLRYDGVDDWLQTNSIDFTGTDKMTVFAGVRKLSDAATGVVAELSAASSANNGSFGLFAPAGAASNFSFQSRGSITVSATATPFAAPTTNVLTGTGDISGDSVVLRVDGTAATPGTTDQGTGNFGNYPLYLGRRGGTTLPFNGRLYGLIVRGAQSTAQQIADTESYMSSKVGASAPAIQGVPTIGVVL